MAAGAFDFMRVAFLPVAAVELGDAVAFYNRQSKGLGFQFAPEVQKALGRIAAYSDAGPSWALEDIHGDA